MRNQFFPIAAITTVVLFLSCNSSQVNLTYTNAKDEVPALGNLVFRFDKVLVSDSLLNQWDSTEYITFDPEIPGRFRWDQGDQLVFSPARPLPPATSFTAKLNSDILQYSAYGKIGGADKITFHTPLLRLENSNVTWMPVQENSTTPIPQVDLYFNYAVQPAVIKEKMKVEVDGTPVQYDLQTLESDSRISMRLLGLKSEDKDLQAMIALEKGIVPEGGRNGTKEKIENKLFIPSPYSLTINDVTGEHDGITGTVYVRTSQQVVINEVASRVNIHPAVKFSVTETEDGFAIHSEQFSSDKSYVLTLKKGLKGRLGGELRESYENNVAFGELEPSLSFNNNKAVYLSAQGHQNIEVRITNVPKVKVIISKIYESNLLAVQRYGYYPRDNRYSSEDEDYYYERDYYNEYSSSLSFGDVIYEKEIDTRSLPKYGNSRLFTFNIEDRLPDFKGIYHIKIRSTTDYWISDSRFISKSDIGLVAKEGKDKLFVFANSIKTAQPLNALNIIVYGNNNQVLGMGTTNNDGVAEVEYSRKEFAGFRPAMVIAKSPDDFNYLPFNSTRVNTSRFEVGGKRSNVTGLDAFVYAERDIYRPGEKINFSVILRDRNWKSPGELPLKLKMLLPNGKELKTFRKTLNAQGALEGDVELSASAITGGYTLEVYTSNDVLLASKSFNVEEFVPDRIKVSVKLDKPSVGPGQTTTLSVNAVNFFGPPAAKRNYEGEVQVSPRYFSPKKYRNYDFGIDNIGLSFDRKNEEGTTDDNGNASISYAVPIMYKDKGLLQATFYATVFDETGRPVSRSATANIYTQQVFFGVGSDGYWYYPLNQVVKFPLIALDKNENVVSAKATVKVIKHEYRTVLTKAGSYFRYESQRDDKIISEQTITVSGEQTAYSFVPRSPGRYTLRVSIPGADSYVSKEFYSYGYWGNDNASFDVDPEGNIDMELDKSSYLAGETAKVLFKTPFDGRMLVTMETDRVVSYQYVNVENRAASVDLKLTEAHLPNVFVTATLIKPHDVSEIPLTVAHGYKNIRVEEKSRRINVEIAAQKHVRSRTRQKVTVKAAPNSYVTLAAVDNGILQITDFKTPDPYGHFYASKALEVTAYDMYPLLFPELKPRISSTGGDGEIEMNKRTNPMPARRFKLVSYWSGIAQTNSRGEASFEFDIPQFSGEIRLMAVSYKNHSFGSADAAMTVADPLVLSTALPRFLSPKDTVTVPVVITNTTDKSTTATATLTVQGPLQVTGSNSQSVSLSPHSEGRAVFRVAVAPAMDVAKVKVEVQGLGEKFTDEIDISVRSIAPLQVHTGSGTITGGNVQRINIPLQDFVPKTIDYKLTVSRNPALELGKQLRYLVNYPYGCTEQTISAAFPQLYFGDLAAQMEDQSNKARSAANFNVLEAIRKIKLRQLYNGAVTMWDGEGTAHWWVTAYAAHFLLEAKKAGFDVDNSVLNNILNYLNNRLKNKETINYYYNQNQQKKIAPREVIYSLYVLALAGKPNVSTMNYYKSNPQLLSLDSKYLLSVAYAIAGDKQKFREILPQSFTGEESVAQTGGSFYSPIRDEAIALNALLDADPANPQIGVMAGHVVNQLKGRRWFSTQECSFSFLALGKIARAANKADVTADIKVNGKTIGTAGADPVSFSAKQLGAPNVEIAAKGNGRLYYYWQSEGISQSGTYTEEDNYIRVRRKFYDRYGRVIAGNSFTQNDLVIVQLTLEKSYSGNVENVVITDMLPAGFEIENPRTKEIPGMDWIKDASTPTALDVRDDRINLFVNLYNNRQVYYYAVRAVSPGTYHIGPASAEAMYNGEYHSYHGAGIIVVKEK